MNSSFISLQAARSMHSLPECPFYILSRACTNFEVNSQNSGTNRINLTPRFKLIQPLNSTFFSSFFSPNYSGTPIPIGIDDCLFRDPTSSSSS